MIVRTDVGAGVDRMGTLSIEAADGLVKFYTDGERTFALRNALEVIA